MRFIQIINSQWTLFSNEYMKQKNNIKRHIDSGTFGSIIVASKLWTSLLLCKDYNFISEYAYSSNSSLVLRFHETSVAKIAYQIRLKISDNWCTHAQEIKDKFHKQVPPSL